MLLGKPTATVGRERELGFLGSMLDECIAEPVARAVLVTGPAGIQGKFRVRYELIRHVRARPDEVESGPPEGDPLGAGSPFGLLAQLIRRSADVRDGEPLVESRAKLGTRVARSQGPANRARIATFLGGIGGYPRRRRRPAARGSASRCGADGRPDAPRFETTCWGNPSQTLLIVLEDVHWGDLPSVRYLDAALAVAKERAFMLLALARPDVRDQFPGLWEQRGLQEIRLGSLTKKSAGESW